MKPLKQKSKAKSKALVPLNNKPYRLRQFDRLSRYIHLYMTPKPDGTRRTRKEAALEAGYSYGTATKGKQEQTPGFQGRMQDYLNNHPELDLRAEVMRAQADILRNGKDSDRLAAGRQIIEIFGEFAPKRVENKSFKLLASIPSRSNDIETLPDERKQVIVEK